MSCISNNIRKFKLSKYNHFIYLEKDDKYLVYNSISNGLAKVEKKLFDQLKSGSQGVKEIAENKANADRINMLFEGNIIVDEDFNELDFLRTRFNINKFSQRNLSLTIVTTLDCNLKCIYCYEKGRSAKYANESTGDEILKFVETRIKNMGYKGLRVTWYGGEPMLNKKYLFSLSRRLIKLCRTERVNYSAMVVTNGTILNKKIAFAFKRHHIDSIQITIDGPKEVHDARRPLKIGSKSSFKKITSNIERVLGIIPIQVRINVDKTNDKSTIKLIEAFDSKGWLQSTDAISFYIGYTREWTPNCSNILANCFSIKEFSKAEIEFHRFLMSKGINIGGLYPSPTSYCTAVSPHAYVIEPTGDIHKCWSDVGDEKAFIGKISEPITLSKKMLDWLTFDPLEQFPDCKECNLFPICGGGCPYVHIKQKEKILIDNQYNCTPWKMFMEEKIRLFLESKALDKTIKI